MSALICIVFKSFVIILMEMVLSVVASVSASYAKPSGRVLLPIFLMLRSVLCLQRCTEKEGETNTYKLPSSGALNCTWASAFHRAHVTFQISVKFPHALCFSAVFAYLWAFLSPPLE